MLGELILWVQEIPTAVVIAIAFAGLLLETTLFVGLLIPGDTVLLITAVSVTTPTRWVLLVAAAVLGALLGETLGVFLGRAIGPRLRRSRLGRRLGGAWDHAASLVDRRGGVAIFVSRFLPVLHSLVPVTAGMLHVPLRRFFVWTLPACILWAVAYVSAGALAAASYEQLAGQLHLAGAAFVGVVLGFLGLVWLARRALTRRLDKPGALDKPSTLDKPGA